MLDIHKVTFSYRPLEDRIRVTAENLARETLRFWLTHRLTSQLIPVLPFQARPLDGADCQMSKDHASNQSVNSETGSSSVVECDEDCEEFLVVSIEIKCHQDRIALVFKDLEEKHRASMSLDLDGSSQFAGALDTCFRAAGWPADENRSSSPDSHVSGFGPVTIH